MGSTRLKDEKETREKLLASAKQEFMEKGYMQASLRTICRNAGVTTGALYFFFKDKEDLFASLVKKPLEKLYEVMNHHYAEEMTQDFSSILSIESMEDDLEAARLTVHYMFQYRDEFQLILTKGQGSGFEKCIEQFVAITEKHYRTIMDRISVQMGKARVDDYVIHWFAHMSIDLFVHMLTHVGSEEEAQQQIETIVRFQVGGWFRIFE